MNRKTTLSPKNLDFLIELTEREYENEVNYLEREIEERYDDSIKLENDLFNLLDDLKDALLNLYAFKTDNLIDSIITAEKVNSITQKYNDLIKYRKKED